MPSPGIYVEVLIAAPLGRVWNLTQDPALHQRWDPRARRQRRFDAYMIYSQERGCIVDYLGTHQHLAVDLELSVAENGGLRIRSGEQRFYEGPLAFRFPSALTGVADVCEWYDDREACFRIQVSATNRRWGPLFGYSGRFQVEWLPSSPETIPAAILPRRVEARV